MDTVTSVTLLEAIKNGQDNDAWGRFTSRYRPMIVAFALRLGLNDSDAEDISQETMLAFLQNYRDGQYNRSKGRFRSWLFSIAQRKYFDFHRKKGQEVQVEDKTNVIKFLNTLEFSNEMERIWEEEWQRSVLNACMAEVAKDVSPQTLSAFEFYVLNAWPVEKVARELAITTNAVYIAKNRVLNQIREIKDKIEDIW